MAWEAEYCARETKAVEAILLAQGEKPKHLGVEDTKVVDEVEFANQQEGQVVWHCNCIHDKVIQVRHMLLIYGVVPPAMSYLVYPL